MEPQTQPKSMRRQRGSLYLCAAACSLVFGVVACTPYNANVHQAKKMAGGGSSGLLTIADRFAAKGDHSAAIPLYREALRQSGNNKAVRIGLARSLMATGQYHQAADALDFARKLNGNDPLKAQALALLGAAEMAIGNVPAATDTYRSAVEMAPDLPAAAAGLAVAEDMNGNHEAALSAYDKGLSANPSDLRLKGGKGLSLALGGDTAEGVALLEDVVRDPAATPRQRQNLALAYVLAGDGERARQMASIDLSRDEVSETIGFFTSLKGMPKEDRMAALLQEGKAPETTIRQPANRVVSLGDGKAKAQASARVVTKQAQAAPAVNSMGDEVDEAGLPPKMDATGWAVQVASYRNPEELLPGWHRIKEKFASILKGLQPRRSEVDFGERAEKPSGKYYRLNAGPLRTKAEALAICKKMRASVNECWVRPPEASEGKLPPAN